jgi:hypothetical protein
MARIDQDPATGRNAGSNRGVCRRCAHRLHWERLGLLFRIYRIFDLFARKIFVLTTGLEPARGCPHRSLRPARLPIPPRERGPQNRTRTRTAFRPLDSESSASTNSATWGWMVRSTGLAPARPFGHQSLKLAGLLIPPRSLKLYVTCSRLREQAQQRLRCYAPEQAHLRRSRVSSPAFLMLSQALRP